MAVSEAQIREIALEMPDAVERPSYGGRPSWRAKKRMFTWIREDPEALVVWVDSPEEKEAMLESEPKKFFTTPHYDGTTIVLVALAEASVGEVRELITDSWRLRK